MKIKVLDNGEYKDIKDYIPKATEEDDGLMSKEAIIKLEELEERMESLGFRQGDVRIYNTTLDIAQNAVERQGNYVHGYVEFGTMGLGGYSNNVTINTASENNLLFSVGQGFRPKQNVNFITCCQRHITNISELPNAFIPFQLSIGTGGGALLGRLWSMTGIQKIVYFKIAFGYETQDE